MAKYFGTDGFRGEANDELTADRAFAVGKFLGWYYSKDKEKARIVIGKDTRRSSYMFEYALCAGITATGADAYILHVTSTPSVAFVVKTEDFDCGIMITASHNPYYDNGIKLINSNGEKMNDEVIALVEDYIDGKFEIPLARKGKIGRTVDYVAGRNRYIGYLISLGIYSFKGKKIGLDCANGCTWNIAKTVFDALGAKTYVINNTPDGFNVNENAGSTHIEVLRKFVVDNELDAGFAFDGDADRCLCVDEKGNILTGDHILYICGKYLKEKDALQGNTVVATVMSNLGLFKALGELGINCVKTKVGDRFVYEEMVKNGYSLGGEQSGHVIFSKYATTGDGMLTALKMMQIMISRRLPMSELYDGLVIYPQVLENISVEDKSRVLGREDVEKAIKKAENELGNSGRILVRESGTEPVIRVMVEAETIEECRKIVSEVSKTIQQEQ